LEHHLHFRIPRVARATIRAFAASKGLGENDLSTQKEQIKSKPHRAAGSHRRWWQSTWFRVAVCLILVGGIALGVAAEYVLHHAAPILRKRVIETLSQRFNSPVQLDSLNISLFKGIEVSGDGLRVPYGSTTNPSAPDKARVVLNIEHFSFRSSFKDLLHSPMRIMAVYVDNMTIDLPAGLHSEDILGPNQKAEAADPEHPKTQPKIALMVGGIHCRNTKLILETSDPNKEAKVFLIQDLVLQDVGSAEPFTYQAHLINPIPKGDIIASGHFGPWNSDDPRETALDGDYNFTHADMNTIKGLGGTLSSVGHFNGVLERLTVDGNADVPDFSLDISDHPMPLQAKFHAFVDATNGDTTLDPVNATLGGSSFTCKGIVANLKGQGHDIALTVDMPSGRIQDLLQLAMKSQPPLMTGGVAMQAKLHIPPGKERVAAKIEIAGNVTINAVHFSNAQIQDKIDGLSMRAQGKPKEVKTASSDRRAEVASSMTVNFALAHELMTVNSVDYQIPGAKLDLHGAYLLQGNLFEFKGKVRTDATASEMTTGWKSLLLKAADPFLKKDGAGLELPISISGNKTDFKFGLATHGADETPAQMAADLRAQRQARATPQP
jgi:hypothetical protein